MISVASATAPNVKALVFVGRIRARRRGIGSVGTRERSAAAAGFHDCGARHHGIQQ